MEMLIEARSWEYRKNTAISIVRDGSQENSKTY